MAMLNEVNYLAVLVAAISSFVMGGLWYGPIFGKPWMGLTGITEEKAQGANMPRTFGIGFCCQLIAALALAIIIGGSTLIIGAAHGIVFAIAFILTSAAVNDLFEQRPLKLWLINAGYNIFAYGLMGAIIGAWH